MNRVALAGLLGRKLRTALTAIAIVLGVAMVSGTFVLTDSIDKAFDSIFTDVRQGSDVVISGKSAFDLERPERLAPRRRSTSRCSRRCARCRASREAEGSVNGEAQLIGQERQGDRLRRRAEPRLQHRERRLAVQPARRSSRARGRRRTRS